jgi:hypothetical protein
MTGIVLWGWGDRLSGCDDVYELSIVPFDFGQDDSNHIKSNQINRSEHTGEKDEKPSELRTREPISSQTRPLAFP